MNFQVVCVLIRLILHWWEVGRNGWYLTCWKTYGMFCMKILQLFEPQLSDCQRQDHLPHARRHLRSDSNDWKLKQIARRQTGCRHSACARFGHWWGWESQILQDLVAWPNKLSRKLLRTTQISVFPLLVDQWKGNSPLNSQGDGIAVALFGFFGIAMSEKLPLSHFHCQSYCSNYCWYPVSMFRITTLFAPCFDGFPMFPCDCWLCSYALSFLLAWQVSTYDPLFVAKEFSITNPNIQS